MKSERSSSPSFDDTDEFDDDIIMHEFGHYLMENYASDDSQGGDHDLTQVDSDLRLAWSEGWGIFLPAAIKSWLQNSGNVALLSTSDITYYVDTAGSESQKTAFISYDITEPWYETKGNNDQTIIVNFYHASSETAVTKILWGIHETVDLGMEKIWDAISQQMVNFSTPTNLASFWDGLLASNLVFDADINQLQTVFNERQVYYQDDASEPDDSLQAATLYTVGTSSPMTNYLYLNGLQQADEDFFVFNASAGKTYKVKTFDLQNGIDTFISILDSGGNVVELNGIAMTNDDIVDDKGIRYDPACFCARVRHDGSAFASELDFTPNTSGDYYVKVWYSNQDQSKRLTTGHYGTYSLSITEQ